MGGPSPGLGRSCRSLGPDKAGLSRESPGLHGTTAREKSTRLRAGVPRIARQSPWVCSEALPLLPTQTSGRNAPPFRAQAQARSVTIRFALSPTDSAFPRETAEHGEGSSDARDAIGRILGSSTRQSFRARAASKVARLSWKPARAAPKSLGTSRKRRSNFAMQLGAYGRSTRRRERTWRFSCALSSDSALGCKDPVQAHILPARVRRVRGRTSPRNEGLPRATKAALFAAKSACGAARRLRARAACLPVRRTELHGSPGDVSGWCERGRSGGAFAWRGKTTFPTHKKGPSCAAESLRCTRIRCEVKRIDAAAPGSARLRMRRTTDELGESRSARRGFSVDAKIFPG